MGILLHGKNGASMFVCSDELVQKLNFATTYVSNNNSDANSVANRFGFILAKSNAMETENHKKLHNSAL